MKGIALIPMHAAGERLGLDEVEVAALVEYGQLEIRDVVGDHVAICEASVRAFTALVGGVL